MYDCLFPHTVGGAERWYRNLSMRLAEEGHEVVYLTLRQWDRGADADVPGVRVVVAGPRMQLYTESGRRRILPPLVFGAGVLWHLLRRGRGYDAVHTASFPYFSLLAAAVAMPLGRYRLVVDWHEAWTFSYWREYLGRARRPDRLARSSACACGFRSGHSASRACTPAGCERRATGARSRCSRASTRARSSLGPRPRPSRWSCSQVGSSPRNGWRR